MWNRSDSVTAPGNVMTDWPDKSGNSHNFSPVNATGPTYIPSDAAFNGLPSLNVDTTAKGIKTVSNVTYGPFTVALCVQVPTQPAAGDIFAHFNGGAVDDAIACPITAGGTSTIVGRVKNSVNTTMTKTDGARWVESSTCKIIVSRFDGTKAGSNIRVNGVTLSESGGLNNDPGLATLTAQLFLFSVNGSTQLMTGKIAELAIYDHPLSTTDLALLETYMKSRYAIP